MMMKKSVAVIICLTFLLSAFLLINVPSAEALGGTVLVLKGSASEANAISAITSAGYIVVDGGISSAYSGTPNPNAFDAVVLLLGNDHSIDMPVAGQTAILDYVNSGGGLVFTEWFAFHVQEGRYQILNDLQCFTRWSGTTVTGEVYTTVPAQAGHPVVQGLPSPFTISVNHGTNHNGALLAGATVLMTGSTSNHAVAVREYGTGKVVQLATAGLFSGRDVWVDANMRILLQNSVNWVRSFWFDDMEGPVVDWIPDGLWHIAEEGVTNYPNSHSGTRSWWYGQEATGDYDTGADNSGRLATPEIDLTLWATAELSFWEWYETEGWFPTFDQRWIQVYTGGVWVDVVQLDESAMNTWQYRTIDLTPYVGGVVRIGFWFDTIDGLFNNYRGWYVDDVYAGHPSVHSMSITPAVLHQNVIENIDVDYTYSIAGTIADTYDLSYVGPWALTFLDHTSSPTTMLKGVVPGESRSFTARISVPATVAPGQHTHTITATSRATGNTATADAISTLARVHNVDLDRYYPNIQDAVDDAENENTIHVLSGLFVENVVVHKPLTIVGFAGTGINGGGVGNTFTVNSDGVTIMGMDITGSGTAWTNAAIRLDNVQNCRIEGNTISNVQQGIWVTDSNNNIIRGNTLLDVHGAIRLSGSNHHQIIGNTITGLDGGGIRLTQSSDNIIHGNTISVDSGNSWIGIWIYSNSLRNTVTENHISDMWYNIAVCCGSSYTIVQDNIVNTRGQGISLWGSNVDHNVITGNTITGEPGSWYGIEVYYSNHNTVSHNTVTGIDWYAIYLDWYSNYNTVQDNNVFDNFAGIIIEYYCEDNTIQENTVTDGEYGIVVYYYSYYNTIRRNTISNHANQGILIVDNADENTILENSISNNWYGVHMSSSYSNHIYHNNFFFNTIQASDDSINTWDDGYPSGGNHWSDWTAPDEFAGPGQDISGSDGIVDLGLPDGGLNPRLIPDGPNQDLYPLVEPFGGIEPGVPGGGPPEEPGPFTWPPSPEIPERPLPPFPPREPDAPEEPEAPETPEEPVAQDAPEIPEQPEEPVSPSEPEEPEAEPSPSAPTSPSNADSATSPAASPAPGAPAPTVPGAGETNDIDSDIVSTRSLGAAVGTPCLAGIVLLAILLLIALLILREKRRIDEL